MSKDTTGHYNVIFGTDHTIEGNPNVVAGYHNTIDGTVAHSPAPKRVRPSSPGKWTCTYCLAINDHGRHRCFECGAPHREE